MMTYCKLLIEIGEIMGEELIACASGSSERANDSGLSVQLCIDTLDSPKDGEQVLPVRNIAVGFLHNTFIILIKEVQNLVDSSTDHKNGHSRRSKAFTSNDKKAAGELRF